MGTHVPGFQSFFRFLHHFLLAKLATISMSCATGRAIISFLHCQHYLLAYLVVLTLNDLKEERGTILHVLGEELKKVAFLVKVNQDIQLLDLREKMKHQV